MKPTMWETLRPGPAHRANTGRAPACPDLFVQEREAFNFLLPSDSDSRADWTQGALLLLPRPRQQERQRLCCGSCREGPRARPSGPSPPTPATRDKAMPVSTLLQVLQLRGLFREKSPKREMHPLYLGWLS